MLAAALCESNSLVAQLPVQLPAVQPPCRRSRALILRAGSVRPLEERGRGARTSRGYAHLVVAFADKGDGIGGGGGRGGGGGGGNGDDKFIPLFAIVRACSHALEGSRCACMRCFLVDSLVLTFRPGLTVTAEGLLYQVAMAGYSCIIGWELVKQWLPGEDLPSFL